MYLLIIFISREKILTLPTLKENVCQKYEKLAGPLRDDFDEGEIERIYKVYNDLHFLHTILESVVQLF